VGEFLKDGHGLAFERGAPSTGAGLCGPCDDYSAQAGHASAAIDLMSGDPNFDFGPGWRANPTLQLGYKRRNTRRVVKLKQVRIKFKRLHKCFSINTSSEYCVYYSEINVLCKGQCFFFFI
jgi:hypothetical protein